MSETPPKPKFVTNITWFQKILAGIAGSCLLVALLTLIDWVNRVLFNNDTVFVSELRKYLSLTAFTAAALVGIPQIKYLVEYLFDIFEFYQKFSDFKRKKKE